MTGEELDAIRARRGDCQMCYGAGALLWGQWNGEHPAADSEPTGWVRQDWRDCPPACWHCGGSGACGCRQCEIILLGGEVTEP